jgi:thiol-disulfide isomerase/thioredoxin
MIPESGRIMPIPHPMTILLRSKAVQKELNLTEERILEIENAVSQFDLPLFRLRDLPPDERNKAAAPHISRLRARLLRILSDRQMKRLNQLVWQTSGIDVILDAQVAERINLRPEQTSRVRTMFKVLYSKVGSLNKNPDLGSASQRAVYIRNLQADTHKNILAILDTYQKNTLRVLMGSPFDFSQVKSVACKAPEFEIDTWLNSPPVKLSEQKGKVTVVHFYAFGCGNCIRSLPYYNDWYNDFPESSFSVIGIHRPETKREHDIEKVKEKAADAGMKYPIAVDNDSIAWNAWANRIWPSIYLIDKNGLVRYWWYGELNYKGAESEKLLRQKIIELINEPAPVLQENTPTRFSR